MNAFWRTCLVNNLKVWIEVEGSETYRDLYRALCRQLERDRAVHSRNMVI